MRGRLFQFLLFSILFFLLISNTQNYSKGSPDAIVQPLHSKNSVICIQNSDIAQEDDLAGPVFGYSWEYFLTETIGFVTTTGGTNYTYSHTFSNSVYDPSGIDTILLYYYVGPIDENFEQVSWIQYDIVSYDVNTNRCSTTLHFNPPIYSDPIFAFYWANDTFGHESRGGLQCYHYDGMNPIIDLNFINENFFGLLTIGTVSMIGITCLIIRKRSDFSNS